jgi:signal transduction histidine kinase
MDITIPLFPEPRAALPGASYLVAYLRALPDCSTTGEVLQMTLDHVLALTGAAGGVGVAAETPPFVIAVGAQDDEILACARDTWVATLKQPECAPVLSAPDVAAGATGVFLVPLAASDRLYGLLALRVGAPLASETLETIHIITRAAGQRLNLQLSLSRMSQRLAELSVLYEIATALGSTLDLQQLLTLIVERTQTALRSEACTLMLLDDATDELVFEIPTGEAGQTLRQFRIPLSEGICGWVARNASPAIVNDLASDPRFDSEVDQDSGFHTRNVLCVPLLVRGRVSGVIEVLNKQGSEIYTNHDLDLLLTLAGQAAVAIDNAQLYTSLEAEHARFLAAEDQVRKELARDLHDGPAQQMAAICMQVEILRKLLEVNPSRLPTELDALETLARKANRQVRTMQFQLRPVVLETRGLRAAMEYYVNQLRETDQIEYTLDVLGCTGRLPANLERAAFDIVQEALGNIRKHSGARHAGVRMRQQRREWVIKIVDDGRGFDVAGTLRTYETRGSLGLLNMRERAQTMGGHLDMDSTPGRGTTVTLAIPTGTYLPGEDSQTTVLEIPPEGWDPLLADAHD